MPWHATSIFMNRNKNLWCLYRVLPTSWVLLKGGNEQDNGPCDQITQHNTTHGFQQDTTRSFPLQFNCKENKVFKLLTYYHVLKFSTSFLSMKIFVLIFVKYNFSLGFLYRIGPIMIESWNYEYCKKFATWVLAFC